MIFGPFEKMTFYGEHPLMMMMMMMMMVVERRLQRLNADDNDNDDAATQSVEYIHVSCQLESSVKNYHRVRVL